MKIPFKDRRRVSQIEWHVQRSSGENELGLFQEAIEAGESGLWWWGVEPRTRAGRATLGRYAGQ